MLDFISVMGTKVCHDFFLWTSLPHYMYVKYIFRTKFYFFSSEREKEKWKTEMVLIFLFFFWYWGGWVFLGLGFRVDGKINLIFYVMYGKMFVYDINSYYFFLYKLCVCMLEKKIRKTEEERKYIWIWRKIIRKLI